MKGGRKNLKRATAEHSLALEDGHCFMRVVDLRGSNLIEVMDAKGNKFLALFPAKFQKSMWIKRGSFVVVDGSGKDEALESGSKVSCIVTKVLFYEQVRSLQKSPNWPEIFKSSIVSDSEGRLQQPTFQKKEENELELLSSVVSDFEGRLQQPTSQKEEENELESSDDDGLPPLEANTNRVRPFELQSDAESRSGSDSES